MGVRYLPIPVRRRKRGKWYRAFDRYNLTGGRPGVSQILPLASDDFWLGNSIPSPDYVSRLIDHASPLNLGGLTFTGSGTYLYRRTAIGLLDSERNWHPTAGLETTKTASAFTGGANDLEPSASWACVAILRTINELGVDRIFKKYADDGSGYTGNILFRDGTKIKHRAYFEGAFVESEVSNAIGRDYSLVGGFLDARDERVGVAGGTTTDWNDTSFGESDLSNTANATLFENWDYLAGTHYVWIAFWQGTDAETLIDNWSSFVSAFWTHGSVNDLTVDANETVMVPAQQSGGLAAISTDRARLAENGLSSYGARTFNPVHPTFYDSRNADSWESINVDINEQGVDGPDGLRSATSLIEIADDLALHLYNPNMVPGVHRLNPYVKFNGSTVEPLVRYNGRDANKSAWDAWNFGDPLSLTSGDAPSFLNGSPFHGPLDNAVQFNNGALYKSALATTGDVALEDILVELIWFYDYNASAGVTILCEKRNGTNEGILLTDRASGVVRLAITDASANSLSIDNTGSPIAIGSWNYGIYGINRNYDSVNGARQFINGQAYGNGNPVAVGTLTNSGYFCLGGRQDIAQSSGSKIAYIAIYKKTDWFTDTDPHLDWIDFAAKRFYELYGIWPYQAQGTKAPTSWGRASAKYTEKIESDVIKLYRHGEDSFPVEERVDSDDETVIGYYPEDGITNLCTYSEEITNWTKINAGDTVTDAAAECPDGRTAATSLIADATDTDHGVSLSIAVTAVTHTFSVWILPGDKDWVRLMNSTVSNCYCDFDCTNGVKATPGAGCTARIKGPYKTGAYRASITFMGTAASHLFSIRSMNDGAGDSDFAGDGETVNTYFFGAQIEANDHASSYIPASGGTSTRIADSMVRAAGDNIGGEDIGQGAIQLDVLFDDYDMTVNSPYLYWIGAGAASADRFFGLIGKNNDDFQVGTRANLGNSGDAGTSAVDSVDGYKHTLRHEYQADSVKAYRDGVLGTEDTSADMPDDIDTIYEARNAASLLQPSCVIQDFKIFTNPTEGTAPSAYHYLKKSITVDNSTTYTVAIVCKLVGSAERHVRLEIDLGTNAWVEFDFSGGIADRGAAEPFVDLDLGNDWHLLAMTFTTGGADAGDVDFYIYLTDENGDTTYQGVVTSGLYLHDVAFYAGEIVPLLARSDREALSLPKSDYEFDNAEMLELLNSDTNTVIVDFEIDHAPNNTDSYGLFSLYEDETHFITFEIYRVPDA